MQVKALFTPKATYMYSQYAPVTDKHKQLWQTNSYSECCMNKT